ncbi:MAG: phosphoribosylformylglycinamidine synthase subunit PurQ, partial [Spirochaetota bacterium]|nr:phosphoribosylformylglycinamidine synthase subunit PurQ [Spirochaetota bacterium]
MKYAIVQFPGSNCDQDTLHAVKTIMEQDAELVWYAHRLSSSYDCVILPGGFSYGDYLRPGAIARFAPVMEDVISLANSGTPVIGICNGFQILLESGLLPGAMLQNRAIHFICKQVHIKCLSDNSPFTNQITPGEVLKVPVAHMDGNYYCDDASYEMLESQNRILFK